MKTFILIFLYYGVLFFYKLNIISQRSKVLISKWDQKKWGVYKHFKSLKKSKERASNENEVVKALERRRA